MAEFQKVFSPQIKALYLRLSTVQKIAMVSVMVALVVLFFIVISLVNGPKMGILFTNLSPRDASEITEKLRENNIQYQLEDTGLTILAPQSKIYALRLSLVVDRMPRSSIVGYELFEPASLDVSNSREELNHRRVLEGELARTIAQFNEVDGVRVNIVIPDKQHSKEDQKEVTASVLLKLKENIVPKRDVIRGIEHLIASSVEGLETANVKVLDSRGVRLSDNHTSESLFRLKSSQYELQANVESYLAQKATTLLEGVVGCGNAIVQVSVE
ncbi:MAG TPA: flagellar basal-body MS-ring/collar protein FliF, partial [Bacteroidota bacterium]